LDGKGYKYIDAKSQIGPFQLIDNTRWSMVFVINASRMTGIGRLTYGLAPNDALNLHIAHPESNQVAFSSGGNWNGRTIIPGLTSAERVLVIWRYDGQQFQLLVKTDSFEREIRQSNSRAISNSFVIGGPDGNKRHTSAGLYHFQLLDYISDISTIASELTDKFITPPIVTPPIVTPPVIPPPIIPPPIIQPNVGLLTPPTVFNNNPIKVWTFTHSHPLSPGTSTGRRYRVYTDSENHLLAKVNDRRFEYSAYRQITYNGDKVKDRDDCYITFINTNGIPVRNPVNFGIVYEEHYDFVKKSANGLSVEANVGYWFEPEQLVWFNARSVDNSALKYYILL